MRILSSSLAQHIGLQVTIVGWLHKKRLLGKITFLIIRDRHGLVQVVDEGTESDQLKGLQNGTILAITGVVVQEPKAQNNVEIHEPKIKIVVPVTEVAPIEVDKPIDHNSENFDTLFTYRPINIRNIAERSIFKIQTGIEGIIREYLVAHDFTPFNSPKLLAGSTEGGAEVFKLDYFGKEATLAQSAQFYKQIMVGAFERVFEINPTYRAELSFTTRHMTEFVHIDVEMGFIEEFNDVLDVAAGLLQHVSKRIWEMYTSELQGLNAKPPIFTLEIPKIPLQQLHILFTEATGEDTTKEKDPTPAEEKWICEYAKEHFGSDAVFITEFPVSDMKFYHFVNESNPNVADRADLLFRGVEIATLSRREHRYDVLVEQLTQAGANPLDPGFTHYLMAFKYGLPPHGGFGMGLERLTQKLIELNSVKEASLFPRDVNRLTP